jgi:stress-induced-phosphoprotein 1
MWDEAAEDGITQVVNFSLNAICLGRLCIKVNKKFIKGYFRLAIALRASNKYKDAIDNIKMGLAVDPGNADLKKQASEMEELMRKDRVLVLISKAREQMQSGHLKDCLATCDRALALDAGNSEIVKIKRSVEPKFEAAEKRRVMSLPKSARDKEAGDKCYKLADFEGAIEAYTRCIDATADKSSELCIKAYSNRSACHKQLSNFDGTIADCTAVLDADINNVKSLVRRAQAFEAVERYKSALQDVKYVLSMPQSSVGQANWSYGMQRR